MSSEFLLEIGTEELPASFVTHALKSMETGASKLLAEARLSLGDVELRTLGTPRRLALRIEGLPTLQPERHETVLGPPWLAAFEEDGTAKKAAVGFAKKYGVPVESLRRHGTDKGDYVSVEVHESGQPIAELLSELLPRLCEGISFPKSMRWGEGDIAFGRPIHWLVALLGPDLVEFEFAGLKAGRLTRGHRFLAPNEIELPSAAEYEALLEQAHVVPNIERRKTLMRERLLEAAQRLDGVLQEDAFLVDECVSLVEAPFVVPGRFDAEFLDLPDQVVVSVMRDHQRYFAVRKNEGGELLPAYLNVVNTAEDPDTISKGNDRVLRARLADARFFVEEDRKSPLSDRLQKLDSVVFQAKLGTMGDKVRRIEALSRWLSEQVGAQADRSVQAAHLCKADLETLIVFEFPELQGQMGRWYAQREGIDPAVADAIADHYRPQGAEDRVPSEPTGAIVAAADRIDTLVGCFGIGLVPTGSADPFALRRAALGLVRIALEGPIDIQLAALIEQAERGYEGVELRDAEALRAELEEFVRNRIRAFARTNHAGDVVDACLGAWDGSSIRDLWARIEAVSAIREQPEFAALAVAFKRAFNITKDTARGSVDGSMLEAGAEAKLAEVFSAVRDKIRQATQDREYTAALKMVAQELGAPIDRYFEDVFVMVEDEKIRENRLRLLGEIADTVNGIAHFHQLST
jgi:glycyl-tRNA synthetase beta chain